MYGLRGKVKKPPLGVGLEGCGQIVALGEGVPKGFLNKKVAFSNDPHTNKFQGSWRQYITLQAVPQQFIPFGDAIEYSRIASVFVNPLTALGFLDVCKKNQHKVIVHSAAASSLGKMMIKLFSQHGVEIINLVRRDEQVDQLKQLGAKYVLNTEAPEFNESFKKLVAGLKPRAFFDAIARDFTGRIIQFLPDGSTAYIYGALNLGPVGGLAVDQFVFSLKHITGFWLTAWLNSLSTEERAQALGAVARDIASGGHVFGSNVVAEFGMEDWKLAITESQRLASSGKVLITPQKKTTLLAKL